MSLVSGKGCILIVDDLEENRELLQQELSHAGFSTLLADSGLGCMEMLVDHEDDIDVILLDWQMPNMDGIETCRAIKQDDTTQDIPVVFISAHRPNEDTIVKALDAGAADFINKPYSPPVLIARIEAQVAVRKAQREQRPPLTRSAELAALFERPTQFASLLAQLDEVGAAGQQDALSCLVLSPDGLNKVNRELGIQTGDATLHAVLLHIQEAIAESDIVAGALAGATLTLIARGEPDEAWALAEQVRANVDRDPLIGGLAKLTVGVAGVEGMIVDEATLERVILRAQRAHARGVQQGGNRAVLWDELFDDELGSDPGAPPSPLAPPV